jgi:uncharacterized membrane protein
MSETPSHGRSILLVVSLCFNLALVGLVVVGFTRAVGGGFIAQPGGALAPAAIARGLPQDEQDRIRAILAGHQEGMRAARRAAQRARREAFRVFAAPDYKADGFAKALDAVREADGRLEDQAIARLLDTINTLTPAERQTVIDRVRSGANQPWWRRLLRRLPPARAAQNAGA